MDTRKYLSVRDGAGLEQVLDRAQVHDHGVVRVGHQRAHVAPVAGHLGEPQAGAHHRALARLPALRSADHSLSSPLPTSLYPFYS